MKSRRYKLYIFLPFIRIVFSESAGGEHVYAHSTKWVTEEAGPPNRQIFGHSMKRSISQMGCNIQAYLENVFYQPAQKECVFNSQALVF